MLPGRWLHGLTLTLVLILALSLIQEGGAKRGKHHKKHGRSHRRQRPRRVNLRVRPALGRTSRRSPAHVRVLTEPTTAMPTTMPTTLPTTVPTCPSIHDKNGTDDVIKSELAAIWRRVRYLSNPIHVHVDGGDGHGCSGGHTHGGHSHNGHSPNGHSHKSHSHSPGGHSHKSHSHSPGGHSHKRNSPNGHSHKRNSPNGHSHKRHSPGGHSHKRHSPKSHSNKEHSPRRHSQKGHSHKKHSHKEHSHKGHSHKGHSHKGYSHKGHSHSHKGHSHSHGHSYGHGGCSGSGKSNGRCHGSHSHHGHGRATHIHVHVTLGTGHNKTVTQPYKPPAVYQYARCDLSFRSGTTKVKGVVFMRQKPEEDLEVKLKIKGMDTFRGGNLGQDEASLHGLHVHEFADISSGCQSFGGHFNPGNHSHGHADNQSHAGDWGNIACNPNGVCETRFNNSEATLFGHHSIAGRGIVLHHSEDDLGDGGDTGSETSGNAGRRLACCAIVRMGPITDGVWQADIEGYEPDAAKKKKNEPKKKPVSNALRRLAASLGG